MVAPTLTTTGDPWVAAIAIGAMGSVYLLAQAPARVQRILVGLCCSLVLTGALMEADRTGLWIGGVWCCDWILEVFWICVWDFGLGCG